MRRLHYLELLLLFFVAVFCSCTDNSCTNEIDDGTKEVPYTYEEFDSFPENMQGEPFEFKDLKVYTCATETALLLTCDRRVMIDFNQGYSGGDEDGFIILPRNHQNEIAKYDSVLISGKMCLSTRDVNECYGAFCTYYALINDVTPCKR